MPRETWVKPNLGFFKFNVDGAARDKLGPADIGGVIHDCRGDMVGCFSESVG